MTNSRKLIVPAAGLSSRFGGVAKFLLRHPSGKLMVEAAISSLGRENLLRLDEVVVITRSDLLEANELRSATLEDELATSLGVRARVHLLDSTTRSMVETITRFIETEESDASFIIRDTDNYVGLENRNLNELPPNFLTYADLRKFPSVSAANKGFVQIDGFGQVIGVIEKQIVGPLVYVGTAGFESYSRFLFASQVLGESPSEHYITDIVRTLISNGSPFGAIEAESYFDWGTEGDWSRELIARRQFVCDLEGYLAIVPNSPLPQPADLKPTEHLNDLVHKMRRNPTAEALILTAVFSSEHLDELNDWLSSNGIDLNQARVVNASTGTPKTVLEKSSFWD